MYLGNSSNTAAATVPGKIHYQGAALGANGKPIKNSTVGLRLSVLDSLPNGSALYTETQTASTDAAGIFSTYLGGGTTTAGTFANIPWSNNRDKFLKAEADITGGTTYALMGISQLVSVPYALHAGSAQRATELMDSAGNAYQIKIVNGQPTLVSAPGNVSIPAPFACGQAVTYAGESYPTVQIGTQCWFQKNVNAGTMVLGANDQTNNGTLEKYCYNNIPAHCDTFGGLYQWGEAVQYQNRASNISSPSPAFAGNVQGICPMSWHVPTFKEVSTMLFFASDSVCNDISFSRFLCSGIANNLRATNFWKITNNGPNTNSSGFNALPSEKRNSIPLFFTQSNAKENAWFWTSNEANDNVFTGINLWMNYNFDGVILEENQKRSGFSVRCLKD